MASPSLCATSVGRLGSLEVPHDLWVEEPDVSDVPPPETSQSRASLATPLPLDRGIAPPTRRPLWMSVALRVLLVCALGCAGAITLAVGTIPNDPALLTHKAVALSGSKPLTEGQIEQIFRNLSRAAPTAAAGSSAPASTNPASTATSSTSGSSGSGTSSLPSSSSGSTEPTSPSTSEPANPNAVQTLEVGQTAKVWDPDEDLWLATITVSSPQFSTSDGFGDTSQYGYFATFNVTVTDIASPASQDTIDPDDSDYYVQADGSDYGYDQANTGNTALAEADNYLGSSVPDSGLLPGQSTTGTVIVDVPSEHGSLVYAPDGTAIVVWTF